MTKFEMLIDDVIFTCFLSKKSRKNINVRIKAHNSIYISKPKTVTLKALKTHLFKNKDWILTNSKKVTKLSEKRNSYVGVDYVFIFNKKEAYPKDISLHEYLEVSLLSYINDNRLKYDEILTAYKLPLPKIKIKKMRAQWGACYVNKQIIYINIYLVHYPKDCLDYVLLHEYLHFIEPNHSKNFYKLIKAYMPNYKDVIKYLKTN